MIDEPLQYIESQDVENTTLGNAPTEPHVVPEAELHIHNPPVPKNYHLLPPIETEEPLYEINKIIKGKYDKDGNIKYLVDWKETDRSYEPYDNLNEAAREFVDNNKVPIIGKNPAMELINCVHLTFIRAFPVGMGPLWKI